MNISFTQQQKSDNIYVLLSLSGKGNVNMQRIFYTVLAILLLYVQSATAAVPELILKKTADTSQMAQAKVIKKSEYKYVPNPQKWEYVFTDNKGRDYWLDKGSIEVTPEKNVIRFSFFNSYIASSNVFRSGVWMSNVARYRLGVAIINYDDNTFTVKKQNNYHSDATSKLAPADIKYFFSDYTLKELANEQTIEANYMSGKFAELLRPYLTNKPSTSENVRSNPVPQKGNTSIKFI